MNEAVQYILSQEQALVGKAANVQREETRLYFILVNKTLSLPLCL